MSTHQLVNDWQAGGTPSTHTCKGCPWTVETYAKPRQETAAAVQAAYNAHLDPMAGLTMPRKDTADVVTVRPGPNGTVRKSRRVTIKRSCDGCGESLGDATEAELEAAMCGHTLPSVAAEHGCQTGAD